jgi:chromatin modification-related protein VID21
MIEAQRRQQAGQPAQLPNGAAQQLRPGSGFGTPQLPATGMSSMQNLANSQTVAHRQALAQMGTPGTMPGVSAQLSAAAIGNRTAQAQLAGQQRLAPQMNGTQANSQDNMRRMVQQMQHQSAMANFNQQQLQGQMGRSTSNNGATNGMSNAAMLSQFNNAMRSPGMQQQQQNGTGPRISPQVSQATPSTGQPQSLSSGHVPPIVNLQHQVRIQHPNMSQTDVTHYATEQLKQMMTQVG